MICYPPYTLPSQNMVAGESMDFIFHLYYEERGTPLYLTNCTCIFSIQEFGERSEEDPIYSGTMEVDRDGDGYLNTAAIRLPESATSSMDGKYVYQFSVKDRNGSVEVQRQGILNITKKLG